MKTYGRSPKVTPCDDVANAELLIVEGDSAARSVCGVRCPKTQAVLAMQGKPLNASKATWKAIQANPILARLSETMATGYQRVVLLMDPDADGIHCGVLLIAFFQRVMPELIQGGRLSVVRAPMFRFSIPVEGSGKPVRFAYASEPTQASEMESRFRSEQIDGLEKIRYRGLGSMDSTTLRQRCVDPRTRSAVTIDTESANAAIALFSR